MQENKTGKYFKYAIGEIILVVIGILIALQLNNWNEQRLQDANFNKLIDALENEIIENIEEASYEIDWARENLVYGSKILSNKISRDEFLKNPNLRNIIALNRLDINSDDIKSLVNRQEDIPTNYDVLIPHLKNYLKKEVRYTKNDLEYGEQITSYTDFLIKTQPWYSDSSSGALDSVALNKQVDFYLNNSIYRNYLTSYMDGYRLSLREMIGVRSSCLVILAEIKRIRENYGSEEIKTLFQHYKMSPYVQKVCGSIEIDTSNNKEVGTYVPLFNASDETKHLRWNDDDYDLIKELELKPGELMVNPASKRMQTNTLLEVISNGKCIITYQVERNGYLLME
ncbi:hypothetical protein [Formosa sp. Hel1_31_208]|uniref:hypothetical protein n=1 Tax=Formosa sp. Hel1_31_208 TaxID=1798225 RepID=UPI000A921FB0|nr:hypothetical protein [Formosa sp. Hel1_31_208]